MLQLLRAAWGQSRRLPLNALTIPRQMQPESGQQINAIGSAGPIMVKLPTLENDHERQRHDYDGQTTAPAALE
jgi:hypothetical protein